MKPVSDDYKNSMQGLLRDNSYARILFRNVNTDASKEGEWSDNGSLLYSETETLEYEYAYGATYAALELNRWALDGNTIIKPDAPPMRDGYISSIISDENGDFVVEPVLVKTFSTPLKFPGLTLTFDTREQEYPINLTVNFYLNDALVITRTIDAQDVTSVVEENAFECDKIEILFHKALPYRRPRIEEMVYGQMVKFENNDLVSVTLSHDVDPLSRRLPQENMNFTILDYEHKYDPDNPSGIYSYVDKNAPVSVQFGYKLPNGTTEWVQSDNYVLNAKPMTQKDQAKFTGTGLIGSLSDIFYKGKLGNKSFYQMAKEVLVDADLTPTVDGDNPWHIDDSLKTMYTTAALPIDTHTNCLQLIAHACCCKLYTDDRNVIHIEPFDVTTLSPEKTDFVLDFGTISKDGSTMTKIEQLKAVSVARYFYTPDEEVSTLYEETTDQEELHIEFNDMAQDIQINVTGGTLLSSEIYARAVDLKLSTGTKSISVTGKTLTESSVVTTYNVGTDGETDREENPLLTNESMCTALANHVASYLQKRNTYEADYRGNPEVETGDVIGLQTAYTDEMDGLVLVDEITFNGALRGRLMVKGLI